MLIFMYWMIIFIIIGIIYLYVTKKYQKRIEYNRKLDDVQHRRAKLELQAQLDKLKRQKLNEKMENEGE